MLKRRLAPLLARFCTEVNAEAVLGDGTRAADEQTEYIAAETRNVADER